MMLLHRCRIVQQLFLGGVNNKHGPLPKLKKAGGTIEAVVATFRCWPIDTAFGHMNNAAYFTVSEMKRWRMFTELGIFTTILGRKSLLVVADQSATYFQPIFPMREYVVSTTLKVVDGKWLHYVHSFEQHPDDVPDGSTAICFAKVKVKAVMKEYSGKTVKPSEFISSGNFFEELVTSGADQASDTVGISSKVVN